MAKKNGISTKFIIWLGVFMVVAVLMVPAGFFLLPRISRLLEKPKPDLPVVRTAKELEALKPIVLSDGTEVRIGLSNYYSYAGGCVIVYCLSSSAMDEMNSGKGEYLLGPISYEVNRSNEKRKILASISESFYPEARFFFNFIHTAVTGEYNIRFYEPEGKEIAVFKIKAEKEYPHPWQSLTIKNAGKKGWVISNTKRDFVALPSQEVCTMTEPPARLPYFPPDYEAAVMGDFKANLSANGYISFSSDNSFQISQLRYRLLARFWINDRPFIPKYINKSFGRLYTGKVVSVKNFTALLDLDYKLLGAKPGDTVKIQFMHVPSWEHVMKERPHSKMAYLMSRNSEIRVSNIVLIKAQ